MKMNYKSVGEPGWNISAILDLPLLLIPFCLFGYPSDMDIVGLTLYLLWLAGASIPLIYLAQVARGRRTKPSSPEVAVLLLWIVVPWLGLLGSTLGFVVIWILPICTLFLCYRFIHATGTSIRLGVGEINDTSWTSWLAFLILFPVSAIITLLLALIALIYGGMSILYLLTGG